MRTVRRSVPAVVATLAMLAATGPAAALADALSAVQRAYLMSGTVAPCRFSSAELEAALRETPTYDQEYFGQFTDAINSALSARAGGACTPRLGPAGEVVLGPAPAAPSPPASVTAGTGASAPFALILAASVLAAGLLLGAARALARRSALDPAWAGALRHSWQEAEYRLGAGWETLRDLLSRPR